MSDELDVERLARAMLAIAVAGYWREPLPQLSKRIAAEYARQSPSRSVAPIGERDL